MKSVNAGLFCMTMFATFHSWSVLPFTQCRNVQYDQRP